ncbi:hypothetical protein [Cellulomonas telluris]|uniref:hypothetical protein n=1 Tax=Cellulomonas telluris TaxID=2306636 RepID=UPI0014562965|nr:hypothetical protein [Cellulomonas telluris]
MDVLAVVSLALVLVATVCPVLVLVRDGRRSAAPSDLARRAVGHVTTAATAATAPFAAALAAVAVTPVLYTSDLPARAIALLPAAALVAHLGVLAVGERTLPRPTGAVREARVERRAPADVAPAADRRLVGAWAATAAGTASALALVASGPRTVSRVVGPYESVTAGPFPGWLWALPALVTVGVALLAVAALVRLVAARSALPGVDAAWDLWLRRRVARRALRGTQLVLGLTVAGLLLVAGVGLRGLAGGGDGRRAAPASAVHEVAGWSLMAAALAVGALALALALRPARDPAPAAAAAPVPAVAP